MIKIEVTTVREHKTAHQFMQHELLRNCNLSGYDYKIEYGEYLSIDGCDEITATQLYISIINELNNQ